MTDAKALLEEWEADGRTGLRPAHVQALRSDLMAVTGIWLPNRRVELEGYVVRMRGQITRKLREAAEKGHLPDDPVED